jgi:hypothetical protein
MAGGIWTSQNKVRPGAYLNFKAVPKGSMTVGDRGIVAMGLPLAWGKSGELIEVLSSDMLDGNSKAKVGFTAFDSDSKLLTAALKYCYKALVYRMDAGGTKASAVVCSEDVTVEETTTTVTLLTGTAKYAGTLGNSITVNITYDSNTALYVVTTYVGGEVVDIQKILTLSDLENNDYIDWNYTTYGSHEPVAGTAVFTGGTNGTVTDATAYPAMFNKLKMARWQTYACFSSESTIKSSVDTFIKQMRDDEGRYVQAVIANYDSANYEGIINSVSGAVIDDVTFSVTDFVAIVAGMSAGSNFNVSNTGRIIDGATSITNEMTDAEIKTALSLGKFLLSTSSSGNIIVEQDINSLHTYSVDRNYNFSKNRVIRTLDEIGTTVCITWDDYYKGKVDNNEIGRALFKNDIVNYCNELQRLAGIQEFAGQDDVSVVQGKDLDSVVADLVIKPVDSMEKLYMTVNVNS